MFRLGFVIAVLLLFGMARAEEEGTVQVPGAFAEVGWNGRFSSQSWVEFRLVATNSGAFKAKLETSEGRVLEGLTPITASLELPDEAGVRETRLILPITTTRMVKITLSGATGTVTKRFEPSATPIELDETRLPLEPSLYLAGQTILAQLEPKTALSALAGGANLIEIPTSLPVGNTGLGGVKNHAPQVKLLNILEKYAPTAKAPERRHFALGLWSVVTFVVLLGLYSLKRSDLRYTIGLAVCSSILAVVGWWASQPIAPFHETKRTVLIGARGWGLKWTIHARFSLRPDWVLPAGVLPLEGTNHIQRDYQIGSTKLQHAGWQQIRYLTPPTATRIPMRLENGKLINESSAKLDKIFIRGLGRQEPLAVGASRQIQSQIYETLPWDEYVDLMQVLPEGTVMAQQEGGTLLIALAEQP
ncbi:MAG: hypothetical protein RLZZ156_1623 [Deinococcota bacterium]|jgi:hypothetical protein